MTHHGDPRFYALLEEIASLHSRKNHDYAPDDDPLYNFRRAARVGVEPWRGVLTRMTDKWSRIEELSKGKTPATRCSPSFSWKIDPYACAASQICCSRCVCTPVIASGIAVALCVSGRGCRMSSCPVVGPCWWLP